MPWLGLCPSCSKGRANCVSQTAQPIMWVSGDGGGCTLLPCRQVTSAAMSISCWNLCVLGAASNIWCLEPAHSGPITGGLWAITWRVEILAGKPRGTSCLQRLNTFSKFLDEEKHTVKYSFILQWVRSRSWESDKASSCF